MVNTADCGSVMHRFDPDIPPQNGKKSKDFKIEIDSYESIFLLLERKNAEYIYEVIVKETFDRAM